ncbi:MAG: phage terminase large subunit [Bacteroidales bacterium]|nr:phage terminase large subunit [Bacteroidales bacterium]
MAQVSKEALERWQAHVDYIQSATRTLVSTHETKGEQLKRIDHAQKDYDFFVRTYFPHYCTDKATGQPIPCASFHIKAARFILDHPVLMAIFMWPRGHAKSTHMGVFIPMWLKIQKKPTIHSLVLAGKSEDSAIRLLSDLQAELQYNQLYEHDFGQQYKAGYWSEGEFTTQDGTAFHAIGRSQSPRGLRDRQNRPDYIICDDLDDDELSRNPARVEAATEWTREALMGTFGAEGGRFIMVGNLISKCSILANIMETPDVHVSRVNVYDKDGNPAWPQYWTKERIEQKRKQVGFRAFEKEYMNNPITLGAVFKEENIVWGDMLPHLSSYRQLICYTDPSWKATKQNDYKATMLVGKTKTGEYHLLKAYAAQTTVTDMIGWHYAIARYVDGRVPVYYYMEANLLQELMLQEFRKQGQEKGDIIPVRGDNRHKPDKFARIEALEPLFAQNLVIFNKAERDSPGMQVLVEQLLAFERGSKMHDDAPDALEGAIWMIDRRWSHNADNIQSVFPQSSNRRY